MKAKIEQYDGSLACPGCGDVNLHQGKVEIWNRVEDDNTGTHVTVNKDVIAIDNSMAANPSLRRQGLSIQFFCEYCSYDDNGDPNGKLFNLNMVQHKGSTYLTWEDPDKQND